MVFNGSPKGSVSITMQYVAYIEKHFPQHEFVVFNVSETIKQLEQNEGKFSEIMALVQTADGILWASPVYLFLFPSQLKRFIELIYERQSQSHFLGKYTTVLTTSVHFFDHAAHNYLNAVCDDLGMKYSGMFSADMDDLLDKEGRRKLLFFAHQFFKAIENKMPTTRNFHPLNVEASRYVPVVPQPKPMNHQAKIVIVVDKVNPDTNLEKMVFRFQQNFSHPPEILDMSQLDIKGGCLGCVRCGYDGECIYRDKDQYIDIYENVLEHADVLVFAGTIRDRFLSSKWKQFLDRGFFRNHTPSFAGRQIGWLISGPLAQVPNLRQILQAYVEWQKCNLVDIVTDEYRTSAEIDQLLDAFAQQTLDCYQENYVRPGTFLGVGGAKVLRDEVWGRFRFPFKADYSFFKKKGWFDFPQKQYAYRIKNTLLLLLSKSRAVRKKIYVVGMKEKMTAKHRRVVEKF